jgi:hypothetical protein
MWGVGVNEMSQVGFMYLSKREVVTWKRLQKVNMWNNHVKEPGGDKELRIMSRVIKYYFWYEKVKPIFKMNTK